MGRGLPNYKGQGEWVTKLQGPEGGGYRTKRTRWRGSLHPWGYRTTRARRSELLNYKDQGEGVPNYTDQGEGFTELQGPEVEGVTELDGPGGGGYRTRCTRGLPNYND